MRMTEQQRLDAIREIIEHRLGNNTRHEMTDAEMLRIYELATGRSFSSVGGPGLQAGLAALTCPRGRSGRTAFTKSPPLCQLSPVRKRIGEV